MSDIKYKTAIEWALECMRHYSDCDISDEDRAEITAAKDTIASLITTIESQKEEIELRKADIEKLRSWLKSSESEIESLKAITELALKGLKEVVSSQRVSPSRTLSIARSTLSEIERLQNA